MKKKFDINEFIWFIILISLTSYFYKLAYTFKLTYFIHPKMFKYVYFSIAIMAVMAVYQVSNIFNSSGKGKINIGYLLFIFILFIGFGVNPRGLNAQAAVNRGIKIGDSIFDIGRNGKEKSDKDTPIKRRPGGAVEVNDENYVSVMNDIYNNIEAYKGKTITVTGFIYKDDTISDDKFVVARMLVSCCAADAQVIGYLFKYNGKENFANEQWVKITGVINEDEVEDRNKNKKRIPIIDVNSMEKINEPMNKYVYE